MERKRSQLFLGHALSALIVSLTLANFVWASGGKVQQLAELMALGGADGDGFGSTVAMSGNTIVIGAADHNESMGAAYVFVKGLGGWTNATQTAMLTASDGQFSDLFGESVAISGDTVVVGAPGATVNGNHSGAVYVFVKPPTGWVDTTQTAKLIPSDGESIGDLGEAVVISGNAVVGGAPTGGDNLGPGAAYVFVKPKTGWINMTQTAKLMASDGMNDDEFGFSAAINGSTIAVGAPEAPYSNGPGPGVAYLFVEPAQGWTNMTETAELTASDGMAGDNFGRSVSIDGDTVATGAIFANQQHGAVYVFVEPASGWENMTETAELEPTTSKLGSSVVVAGNGSMIVAGANGQNNGKGAVYVFLKPPNGWITTSKSNLIVKANNSRGGDYFGASVSVSGSTGVVGAPNAPFYTQNGPGPGAAYVFGP